MIAVRSSESRRQLGREAHLDPTIRAAPVAHSHEARRSREQMAPDVVGQMRADGGEQVQLDPDEAEDEVLAHRRFRRQTHLSVFVARQLQLEETRPERNRGTGR